MAKKFDAWMIYHRKLLEKAVENYGRFFKKQDLYQFDKSVSETKSELIKNKLLENWEPTFHLNSPMEFLFLNEQLSDRVPADVTGALKTQINSLKRLRSFYDRLSEEQKHILNAVSEDESDSALSFEEELKALEEEINKIYDSGIRGWAQRGLGRFFNVGRVNKSRLAETSSKENINELFGTLALGSLALGGLLGKRALEKRAQRIQKLQQIAQKAVAEYGFDRKLLLPVPTSPLPPPPPPPDHEHEGHEHEGHEDHERSINIMAGSKGKGLQSIIMNSIREEDPSVDFKTVQPQIASVLNALRSDLQKSKKFSAVNEKAGEILDLTDTSKALNTLTDDKLKNGIKSAIRNYLFSYGFKVKI